jgi:hypothetical protein
MTPEEMLTEHFKKHETRSKVLTKEHNQTAKDVKTINFPCNVDQTGCAYSRSDKFQDAFPYIKVATTKNPENLEKGCCQLCYAHKGYISHKPTYYDKQIYKKLFKQEVGFWRKGGCSLPYRLRSWVCLEFMCPVVRKLLSLKDRRLCNQIH